MPRFGGETPHKESLFGKERQSATFAGIQGHRRLFFGNCLHLDTREGTEQPKKTEATLKKSVSGLWVLFYMICLFKWGFFPPMKQPLFEELERGGIKEHF